MYTIEERELFYNQTIDFFRSSALFEGVVHLGSGTVGYKDEYSDIDLMAAYYNKDDIIISKAALINFFKDLGASYINELVWTKTVLGVSVYFPNGLGVDVSFGPTNDLVVQSPQWKIVLDKTGKLTEHIKEKNKKFERHGSNYGINDSINYRFINALRRYVIAIKRCNYIYASNMLNEARQCVLDIQALNEGKKVHQFKEYNALNRDFLIKIADTFPSGISERSLNDAKNHLYRLFFEAIDNNNTIKFDDSVLVLLAGLE